MGDVHALRPLRPAAQVSRATSSTHALSRLLGSGRSMNEYEIAASALLRRERVGVRRYRSATTGRAYHDGSIVAPRARGPISFATLAHEVGHVACEHVGPDRRRQPRYVEEVEAWEYALACFERFELKGVERAHVDAAQCIAYAFSKAIRRGASLDAIRERFPSWWADALKHERYGRLARDVARA